jgi:hypothetical protein
MSSSRRSSGRASGRSSTCAAFPARAAIRRFNRSALEAALDEAGIVYRHAVELGGRLSGEPGEERFDCIRVAAFRSYAARMGTVTACTCVKSSSRRNSQPGENVK